MVEHLRLEISLDEDPPVEAAAAVAVVVVGPAAAAKMTQLEIYRIATLCKGSRSQRVAIQW